MTFGQKIKMLRSEANLTQKDLAEKMNVTFQTVSKWESDLNEPDMATIKELSKVFNCSIEYLFSEDETVIDVKQSNEPEEKKQEDVIKCADCGKGLHNKEDIKYINRKNEHGETVQVPLCSSCLNKAREEENQKAKAILDNMDAEMMMPQKEIKNKAVKSVLSRKDRVPLIWAIVVGALVAVIALIVCIVNFKTVGIAGTILLPLGLGYIALADIYCIFTDSYISDVFMSVAGWSVHFPGIIFSFSMDGLKFLIIMKIVFAIAGVMISIAVFLLALAISSLLSFFSFVPILIYNKNHY